MKYRVWHIKEERYLKDDMGIIDSPVNVFVAPNEKVYQLVECLMAGIILQDITDEVIVEWGVEVGDKTFYEGDDVQEKAKGYNSPYKGTVKFVPKFKGFAPFCVVHTIFNWEKIGNIHDKELDNDR